MSTARRRGGGDGMNAKLVSDPGEKFSVLVHEQ